MPYSHGRASCASAWKLARRSSATTNVCEARSSAACVPARRDKYRWIAAKCRSKIVENRAGSEREAATMAPSLGLAEGESDLCTTWLLSE